MAGLRERIGSGVLKQKLKTFTRETRVCNLKSAETALILFDAMDAESFPVVKSFMRTLEKDGISCQAYSYVNQKEIPQELLLQDHFQVLTRSDINWYHKPQGEIAEQFYRLQADLLVDFNRHRPLVLQYLTRLSRARFKVGCYTEMKNDFDLMISLKEEDNAAFLSEQFLHYLGMLNPA